MKYDGCGPLSELEKSFLLPLFSYQLITFTVQLFNNANSSNWQYLPSPAFQIGLSQGVFHTGLPMKYKLSKYLVLRKLLTDIPGCNALSEQLN